MNTGKIYVKDFFQVFLMKVNGWVYIECRFIASVIHPRFEEKSHRRYSRGDAGAPHQLRMCLKLL